MALNPTSSKEFAMETSLAFRSFKMHKEVKIKLINRQIGENI